MKLGVFFVGSPRSGGLYQYALSIMDSLERRSSDLIVFNLSGADFPYERYENHFTISNSHRLLGFLRQLGLRAYLGLTQTKEGQEKINNNKAATDRKRGGNRAARLLRWLDIRLLRLVVRLNRVDLLVFTAPNQLSFQLNKPYIMPVHDLQHRLNPQFPEVSAGGLWEEREYLYSNAIPKAATILVDSETGREDVLSLYHVDGKNVKILPYVPPSYLKANYTEAELAAVRQKYNLPQRFLFYPANFWPHKNHKLIIEALNRLKVDHDLKIPAVFVGAKQLKFRAFSEVESLVRSCGLDEQVMYPGYVSNEEMGCLYKLAEALVMPTFFGPTNIPYLEAFALGCPVIGSKIRGVIEQVGDAGLLVDPNSAESLAAAILQIWNDAGLKEKLVKRGHDKISVWNFEKFSEALNKIIDEAEGNLPKANCFITTLLAIKIC